jgi:pimeloyl-ACP methyl ester carboxylesterase
MTFVEVESGIRCFAQDLGPSAAHPVVFIAGFGLSHPVWDGEVRELLAAGHRVVCIDLRGTGRSDKPAGGYEVERLSADVERVCEALAIADATFVGWSFGGHISFHLAATNPALVAKLVLLASTAVRASRSDAFPFRDPPEAVLAALQAAERRDRLRARRRTIAPGFASQPPDSDTLQFLIGVSLQMPSWAAIACYESYLLSDFVDEIERVTQPVLQVVGDSDPVTPLEAVEWLQARLANARTTVLQGCGHYPMFEAGPELREALVKFASE